MDFSVVEKINMKTLARKIWDEKNRDRINAYHRAWRKKLGEEYRKYKRIFAVDNRRKQRLKVITAYGGKCVCCLEDRFEFLAIDHKNGDGANERKTKGINSSSSMIQHIIKNKYPDKYRILCHNCNSSIGFHGYCPHGETKNGI